MFRTIRPQSYLALLQIKQASGGGLVCRKRWMSGPCRSISPPHDRLNCENVIQAGCANAHLRWSWKGIVLMASRLRE